MVALTAWLIVSARLKLPGLNETIQDFATYHFRVPDILDPYDWLYRKNLWFWPIQWRDIRASPWPIFAFAFAIFVLFRKLGREAWLWVISGTTGLWLLIAHPAYGEYDRLMQPMWITVACAFGWAAARGGPPPPPPRSSDSESGTDRQVVEGERAGVEA